jgi:hypothetical protein
VDLAIAIYGIGCRAAFLASITRPGARIQLLYPRSSLSEKNNTTGRKYRFSA